MIRGSRQIRRCSRERRYRNRALGHDLKPGPVGDIWRSWTSIPRAMPTPFDLNHPNILTQRGSRRRNPIRSFTSRCLCGSDAHDRPLRASARPQGALGAPTPLEKRHETVPDNGYARGLRSSARFYGRRKRITIRRRIRPAIWLFPSRRHQPQWCAARPSFGVVAHDNSSRTRRRTPCSCGLHPRYSQRTNVDMAAFHEAFADIRRAVPALLMPETR